MLDEVMYKRTRKEMHQIGWKANYFNYSDVSILGHGCGVSQFPQCYDRIYKDIKYYHIHMWEVMKVKVMTFF